MTTLFDQETTTEDRSTSERSENTDPAGKKRLEAMLEEGETALYNYEGSRIGTYAGRVQVTDGVNVEAPELRICFDVKGLDEPLRPTVSALVLRADLHWQFEEEVLGEYVARR